MRPLSHLQGPRTELWAELPAPQVNVLLADSLFCPLPHRLFYSPSGPVHQFLSGPPQIRLKRSGSLKGQEGEGSASRKMASVWPFAYTCHPTEPGPSEGATGSPWGQSSLPSVNKYLLGFPQTHHLTSEMGKDVVIHYL